jgi:hypothetical protein
MEWMAAGSAWCQKKRQLYCALDKISQFFDMEII